MGFKITHSDGHLHLNGELNINNLSFVKKNVNSYFKKNESIVLDIDNVTEIDPHGIDYIIKLYQKAKTLEKKFLFYGKGSRDIIDELQYRNIE
ncbi:MULTISPECIES: STAS domain-containing protein [unclassified Tenacibaculum]|uniref:STAS domain-containing protein n=1 Tax=unclassified Tenacibaculum TaxID=2635139 RepID=UPI001F1919F3|nr:MULTISPECIES: STAS domain-containing protein [unclassified Tenacibaculum]MCF2875624.1 STAS domain-containing protein [Tenacibaculum sp. Cn5-1]MCF2935700.1 STAS domain-containing protein [Tenacibaculum sp. Cn5-34]MCG7512260.1 STAS domain-containing protein [Tenacibaculum sp. Cn5-46]